MTSSPEIVSGCQTRRARSNYPDLHGFNSTGFSETCDAFDAELPLLRLADLAPRERLPSDVRSKKSMMAPAIVTGAHKTT